MINDQWTFLALDSKHSYAPSKLIDETDTRLHDFPFITLENVSHFFY